MEAVVVAGVFREAQARVSGFVDGVGVLAEFIEIIIVGRIQAAAEKIEVVVEAVAFRHEQQVAFRMAGAQDGERFVPVRFVVDEMGHVEPEAVNAVGLAVRSGAQAGEPMVVDLGHGVAQGGLGIVQLGGIGPVTVEGRGAIGGLDVVFGMFAGPHVVAGGMVGGDVEDDLELELVRAPDEGEGLCPGAVFRFDVGEVSRGVGRTDTLAGKVPDGVGRQQVQNIETETAEARQVAGQIGQGDSARGFSTTASMALRGSRAASERRLT